jgi:hypothetical protein
VKLIVDPSLAGMSNVRAADSSIAAITRSSAS